MPELAPKKIVIQTSDKEEYETDFNLWISSFHYSYVGNLYIYYLLLATEVQLLAGLQI